MIAIALEFDILKSYDVFNRKLVSVFSINKCLITEIGSLKLLQVPKSNLLLVISSESIFIIKFYWMNSKSDTKFAIMIDGQNRLFANYEDRKCPEDAKEWNYYRYSNE